MIIDQQDASGGMWAFSEGNEVMFFLVLLYLLRPVCVNAVGASRLLLQRRPSGAVRFQRRVRRSTEFE